MGGGPISRKIALRNTWMAPQRVVLILDHDGMSTRGRKQEYSDMRLSNAVLFVVLRELHLMKGLDTEAIFSVVCLNEIIKKHNIKAPWDTFFG